MGYATEQMLIVGAVLAILVLVLRWAYSSRPDSLLSRRPKTGSEHEYGLMSPLAAPKDAAEGAEICALLLLGGIRARSVLWVVGGGVLVWWVVLARARDVLLG
jgi:hypothetical protein